MPKVTVYGQHETYTYEQCDTPRCISGRGEEHGNAHMDFTGTTFGRACLICSVDLTDTMGVRVFISWRPSGEKLNRLPLVWCAPDDDLLCVKCGNNGANTLKYERYRQLKGVALLPKVPVAPNYAWRQ